MENKEVLARVDRIGLGPVNAAIKELRGILTLLDIDVSNGYDERRAKAQYGSVLVGSVRKLLEAIDESKN